MTPDERKAWEEEVRWATWYVPATESKCSFDPPLRRNAKAILSADVELTALRARVAVLEKEKLDAVRTIGLIALSNDGTVVITKTAQIEFDPRDSVEREDTFDGLIIYHYRRSAKEG